MTNFARRVRIARSIIQTVESSVDAYLRKISEEDKNIYAFLPVMDAECKLTSYLSSSTSVLTSDQSRGRWLCFSMVA
jgi:hypothetical protein